MTDLNPSTKRIDRSKGMLGLVQIEPFLRINRKKIDLNQIISANENKKEIKPVRKISTEIALSSKRIAVIIHSTQMRIDYHSLEVLLTAQILANQLSRENENYLLVAVCFGSLNEESKKQLSQYGADEVIEIDYSNDKDYQPDLVTKSVIQLIEKIKPEHSFFSEENDFGQEILRRVISETNLSYATDVNHLNQTHLFRSYQNETKTQKTTISDLIGLKKSIPSGELPYRCEAKLLKNDWIDSINKTIKTHLEQSKAIETEYLKAEKIDLAQAPFVLSAGNGVRSMDKFSHLAKLLGAQIGGSRVIVDEGKLARDQQVGLTGKILDAKLYFCFGISGAIQHLQGIEKCESVIAVNLDASAPIFKRANLAIEEDAEILFDALIARLSDENSIESQISEKAS